MGKISGGPPGLVRHFAFLESHSKVFGSLGRASIGRGEKRNYFAFE
jgi:hypothetical protein